MNFANALLVLLLSVNSFNAVPLSVGSKLIEVPKDYSSIQLAINEANPGDTIQVAAGIYFESLKITKPLSLVGRGPENTVIMGNGTVVLVNADNVEIRGFAIRNGTYGIFLSYSSGVLLRNNAMSDNRWNFGAWGDSLSHFIHDVDPSNMVDGKPIYYWVNENGKHVSKDAGYVALINSTKVIAEDLCLTSNEQGVLLVNTKDSTIRNVTILGNDLGIDLRASSNNTVEMNSVIAINWLSIYLVSSKNNTFTENTISEGNYGISATNSSGNAIYHNNFIGNHVQQYQVNSFNKWDNGSEGNYWSDYRGEDLDGDGVGDTQTPHLGVDYHPLMNIYDTISPIAHAGEDQTVFRNTPLNFDASGSSDNIGIDSYFWDFGDGSVGDGVTTTHIYTAAGNYTVTLTVKDLAGNKGEDTIIVFVKTPRPFEWWIIIVGISAGASAIAATILWTRKSIRKRKGDKS